MTKTKVKIKDGVKTTDRVFSMVNAQFPRARFRVVAEQGISYSHEAEPDGIAEKGKIVVLQGPIIAVLMAEGAIEPADEF